MYKKFYRLNSEPFRLTPDPRFVFAHRSYRKAYAYMRHTLQQGDGFLVITGRSGTGKTTLVENFVSQIRSYDVHTVTLVSTQLEVEDLLRMVAYALNLNPIGLDKASLLHELKKFLSRQKRTLLIIDEAQNLSPASLEEIRLLTNLHINSRPLLQIFLVGQRRLRDLLHQPKMEQLHQRLMAACYLEPLTLEETRDYVIHRLNCAGWRGDPTISPAAFVLMHRFSQGLPRYISKICTRLFLHGAVEQRHLLGPEDLLTVLREIQDELLLPFDLEQDAPDQEAISGLYRLLVDTDSIPNNWEQQLSKQEWAFIDSSPDPAELVPKSPQSPPSTNKAPTAVEPVGPNSPATLQLEPEFQPEVPRREASARRDVCAQRDAYARRWRSGERSGSSFLPKYVGYGMAASILLASFSGLIFFDARKQSHSADRALQVAHAQSAPVSTGQAAIHQAANVHWMTGPLQTERSKPAKDAGSQASDKLLVSQSGTSELVSNEQPSPTLAAGEKGSGQVKADGAQLSADASVGDSIAVPSLSEAPSTPVLVTRITLVEPKSGSNEAPLVAPDQPIAVTKIPVKAADPEEDDALAAYSEQSTTAAATGEASALAAGEEGTGVQVDDDKSQLSADASVGDSISVPSLSEASSTPVVTVKQNSLAKHEPASTEALLVADDQLVAVAKFLAEAANLDGDGTLAVYSEQTTTAAATGDGLALAAPLQSDLVSFVEMRQLPFDPPSTTSEDRNHGELEDPPKQRTNKRQKIIQWREPVTVATVQQTSERSLEDPDNGADALNEELQALLKQGEQAVADNRLRFPGTRSAWYYYRQALGLDPGNPDALQGLSRIADRYWELATGLAQHQRYQKALKYIERGLGVVAEHDRLLALRQEVQLQQDALIKLKQRQQMLAQQAHMLATAELQLSGAEPESGDFFDNLKTFFSNPKSNSPDQIFSSNDR